jgi:hypothetical protein
MAWTASVIFPTISSTAFSSASSLPPTLCAPAPFPGAGAASGPMSRSSPSVLRVPQRPRHRRRPRRSPPTPRPRWIASRSPSSTCGANPRARVGSWLAALRCAAPRRRAQHPVRRAIAGRVRPDLGEGARGASHGVRDRHRRATLLQHHFAPAGSFAALRVMRIECSNLHARDLERAVSTQCPCLQDLNLSAYGIVDDHAIPPVSIRSDSLARLVLCCQTADGQITVDAPRLVRLEMLRSLD